VGPLFTALMTRVFFYLPEATRVLALLSTWPALSGLLIAVTCA
jgi:hypothetical protein